MISEVPVTQEEIQEEIQEIQEAEEANPPPPPPDVPKKRGRPKKEPVPEPVPEPEPVPKKKPKAKPKAEPKVKSAALAERAGRADLTTIVEEARFSVNDLSNAQLISELVNRQRATQREMKTNLYRSFVM
jgi:outer membrane biosynthesis protein TonB